MGRLTKRQRVTRLMDRRKPLDRRHERLTAPEMGSTRHDGWGVCKCVTAQRLRNIAVALAAFNTPTAKGGPDAR